MPNIVIKDAKGQDEIWPNVNSVSFLDEQGQLVNYDYNGGDPTWSPPYRVAEGKNPVWFLDFWGNICHYVEVENGGCAISPKMPKLSEDGIYEFTGWNYSEGELNSITRPTVVASLWKVANLDIRCTAISYLPSYPTSKTSSFSQTVYFAYKGTGSIEVKWEDTIEPEIIELSPNNSDTYKSYSKSHTIEPDYWNKHINDGKKCVIWFKKHSGTLQITNQNAYYHEFFDSYYFNPEFLQVGTDIDEITSITSDYLPQQHTSVVAYQKCYSDYYGVFFTGYKNSTYIKARHCMLPAGSQPSIIHFESLGSYSGYHQIRANLSFPSNYIEEFATTSSDSTLNIAGEMIVIPKWRIGSSVNRTYDGKLIACQAVSIDSTRTRFLYINIEGTKIPNVNFETTIRQSSNGSFYGVPRLNELQIYSKEVPVVIADYFPCNNRDYEGRLNSYSCLQKIVINASLKLVDQWCLSGPRLTKLQLPEIIQLGNDPSTPSMLSACGIRNNPEIESIDKWVSVQTLCEMAYQFYKVSRSYSNKTQTVFVGTAMTAETFSRILQYLFEIKKIKPNQYQFTGFALNDLGDSYLRFPNISKPPSYFLQYLRATSEQFLKIVIPEGVTDLTSYGVFSTESYSYGNIDSFSGFKFYFVSKTPPKINSNAIYNYSTTSMEFHVPKDSYEVYKKTLLGASSYFNLIYADLTDEDIVKLKGDYYDGIHK